ncbi:MAG TPA: thioredoxin family protein [Nitrospirota bacterium]|nr:thioredoxin family protein [Nitrospirota bacterium]
MALKIDVYMSETCGSYHQLREYLVLALAELRIRAEVTYHTVYFDEAVNQGIKGSPSIWINGKDAFEGVSSPGIT